jgi:asparagine synthase (glutamine-hydrolysing)
VDRLEEAVIRAVRRRVPRGIETGLYLSGGLGSTAIAAAAQRRFLRLPSFTVTFADDLYPEMPFAGRVASLLGLEHHQVEVGTKEVVEGFEKAVRALGHPIGHPAVVLQQALAHAAADRVPVALSGDGAEELFGGRMLDRLGRGVRLARAMRFLPRAVAGPMGRLAGVGEMSRSPVQWVLQNGLGGHRLFSAEDRGRLLRDQGLVRRRIRPQILGGFYEDMETDAVNTALHGSLRSWLSESAACRYDLSHDTDDAAIPSGEGGVRRRTAVFSDG